MLDEPVGRPSVDDAGAAAMAHTINLHVAGRLEEAARLLRDQGADPYRVRAYRRAAIVVRGFSRPVDEIFRLQGLDGLKALPAVGETIARAIRELVVSGRLPMLERLRGESDPVTLLASVPGIGVILADRLHDELGLETLADLEAAAHDGIGSRLSPDLARSVWREFGTRWRIASAACACTHLTHRQYRYQSCSMSTANIENWRRLGSCS